ncbi:glycosyltransferase family 2 protein [Pseudodesulfovibrio tunisiensis]|uniref:glycosyltransferase family 2 protein n=1 Tax=Pseudodesulfovibrio tunisiensis TaxID=463192 RepID=UPI001FB424ED|nr:glycosyltransferase [Pseudodesulfovibrio tunisiensis]
MKKVSIVIPCYNQDKYLGICLDSAWFQEYPNLEIVVVDDGSTDRTPEVLEQFCAALDTEKVSYAARLNDEIGEVERVEHLRYAPEGRELRVIRHDVNKGLSEALNTGFRACTGELCTFIASDDMLLPGMVSGLVRALEENNADFAYADMHVVDDTGRILRRFSLPDYTFEAAFCQWYLVGVCKLYRRELHERCGYFDPAIYPQDHDMYLRFAMSGAEFVHVPRVLANVRHHGPEREVHNHSNANWNRLFEQSSDLVRTARKFAQGEKG